MNDEDRNMFNWVRKFNPYDLYSKGEEKPSVEKLAAVLRRADRRILPEEDQLVEDFYHDGTKTRQKTFFSIRPRRARGGGVRCGGRRSRLKAVAGGGAGAVDDPHAGGPAEGPTSTRIWSLSPTSSGETLRSARRRSRCR